MPYGYPERKCSLGIWLILVKLRGFQKYFCTFPQQFGTQSQHGRQVSQDYERAVCIEPQSKLC